MTALPTPDPIGDAARALQAAVQRGDPAAIAGAYGGVVAHGPAGYLAAMALMQSAEDAARLLDGLKRNAVQADTIEAWGQVADAALGQQSAELAATAAAAMRRLDEQSATARFYALAAANQAGDGAAALRHAEELAALAPDTRDDSRVAIQTAMAEMACEHHADALARLDRALPQLRGDFQEGQAQALRARALAALGGREHDRIAAWRSALALAPAPAPADQARQALATELIRLGRRGEAVSLLEEGVSATQDAAARMHWRLLHARTLAEDGQTDSAIQAYEALANDTPDAEAAGQLRLAQARLCAEARRARAAADYFDAAISAVAGRDADANARRTNLQGEKVQRLLPLDYDLAAPDLDQLDALAGPAEWPTGYDLRLSALLDAGRLADARAWLDGLRDSAPQRCTHPAWAHARSELQLKAGHLDDALQEAQAVLRLAASGTDPRGWGAVLVAATLLQRPGEVLAAGRELRRMSAQAAEHPNVRVLLANAHLRTGEAAPALALTEGELPGDPMMALLHAQVRGQALIDSERLDEAMAALQAGIALAPRLPTDATAQGGLLLLRVLLARVYLAQGDAGQAVEAATQAIDGHQAVAGDVLGLVVLNLVGAHMLRAMARLKLKQHDSARRDVLRALELHRAKVAGSAADQLARLGEPGDLLNAESTLWLGLGQVCQADERQEEALAAFARADGLEQHGNRAGVAHGYALCRTGDCAAGLVAFLRAQARAVSEDDRAQAHAGQGWALLRLGRHADAVSALQAAVADRLTDPEDDAAVFEWLGMAYDALGRHGAASRAYRQAWRLTPEAERSVNLALGVSAAELKLKRPKEALDFLDQEASAFSDDARLQLNRALALDQLGRRPEAIVVLRQASQRGQEGARAQLARLDAPVGIGRWTQYWFGLQASGRRRLAGTALLLVGATVFAAPWFQWQVEHKVDWALLLLPAAVALALLALPNIKTISGEAFGVKLEMEPIGASERDAARAALPLGYELPPSFFVSLGTGVAPPALH